MSVCAERSQPLGGAFANGLRPILTALGALYLALLINHTLIQPNLKIAPMVLLASATTVLFFGTRLLVGRFRLPPNWVESVASAVAGLVLAHSALHLYLLSNFLETTNLGLLGLGLGSFFLSSRRLSLVLTVTLAVWLALALTTTPSVSWLYFAFGLFAATGLRLYTECRNVEMASALRHAEEAKAGQASAEQALRKTEQRLELVAAAARDGLWEWDLRSEKVYYSPRWKAMASSQESFLDTPNDWFQRVHPQDAPALRRRILAHLSGVTPLFEAEYRLMHADGRYRWMQSRALAVRDDSGRAIRIGGSQTDLTETKTLEHKLALLSSYDSLTRLPNRSSFLDRVSRAALRASTFPNYTFAILLIDFDGFWSVNETWGRTTGNWILQTIATRLKEIAGPDKAARLAGDVFAVVLEDVESPAGAVSVAENIREELSQPYRLDRKSIFITASLGVAWGKAGKPPDVLLQNAEEAAHRAKRLGGNQIQLSRGHLSSFQGLRLQDDLHAAIENGELQLRYAPVLSKRRATISGTAVRLYWNHPTLGLLPSERFLAAAEETGLIKEIGLWLLSESCARVGDWRNRMADEPLSRLSISVSAGQLRQVDLSAQILRALRVNRLEPSILAVGICEAALLSDNAESAKAQLWELKENGVRIELDQFGTRHSPPDCLHRFPFNAVRIVCSDFEPSAPRDQTFLHSLVQMARDLSVAAILEGVESPAQLERLAWEFALGNGLGAPVSPLEFEAMLGADS